MTLFVVMESLIMGFFTFRWCFLQVRAAGLSSPALRHTQGNVQTTVECATDIAGKHLFDRA